MKIFEDFSGLLPKGIVEFFVYYIPSTLSISKALYCWVNRARESEGPVE